MRKKKNKFAPKYTKEEYKELTGQGLGSLKNQGTSTVTNNINTRVISNTHG